MKEIEDLPLRKAAARRELFLSPLRGIAVNPPL